MSTMSTLDLNNLIPIPRRYQISYLKIVDIVALQSQLDIYLEELETSQPRAYS